MKRRWRFPNAYVIGCVATLGAAIGFGPTIVRADALTSPVSGGITDVGNTIVGLQHEHKATGPITVSDTIVGFQPEAFNPITAQVSFQSNHLGMPSDAPAPVPGPIAGAGLPGLIGACVGLFALSRSRSRRRARN